MPSTASTTPLKHMLKNQVQIITNLKSEKVQSAKMVNNESSAKQSKVKRYRPSWQQRILLEQIFEKNQYPDLNLRTQLAGQLGITPRKVQIWFQNRRTKEKNNENEGVKSIGDVAALINYAQTATMFNVGNAKTSSEVNPLYTAVAENKFNALTFLLSSSCDPNVPNPANGQTALHVAALKGYSNICWSLLTQAKNIDVNARDYENRTPLHHAAIYGHLSIVKQLLHHGAQINAISTDGNTPLHCATLMGYYEVTEYLLDKGANINDADKLGFTALHFAVREKHAQVVQLLLNHNANLNAFSKDRITPLHIAHLKQHQKIYQMLAGTETWQRPRGLTAPKQCNEYVYSN